MKTHNIIPGTPEWHAHRVTHRNASDAPAMLGCSPYKTRTQLLNEKRTGITPEVDAGTEARFADGHRFEALARPIGEEIIGDDLAPVVGSEGKESASYDGLTLMGDAPWEHKSLNDEIRAALPHQGRDSHLHNDGAKLGKVYRVQMEQQLLVCGAARNLFSATRWEGDELQEERHAWYHSDPALRAEILAGWGQFDIDLATHEPAAQVVEVVGSTPETLPALTIIMKGEVSASNLEEFKQVALTAIRSVNRDLKTDQDFADSAKARKWCEDIETRVAAAKDHALGQTKTIDDLFRTMDEISAEARDVRLALEKLEKARKESRRGEIVAGGIKALADHVSALNTRLGKPYLPATACDFGGAIKGLRTFDSMQNAVDTALANAKIISSATADKIQTNLTTLRELAAAHAFLFADTAQIVLKAPDDLAMLVKSRISEHQASEEKKEAEQRDRIRAEEVARLEREQATKAADELKAAEAAKLVTFETVVAMMPATVIEAMNPAPACVQQAQIAIEKVASMPIRGTSSTTVSHPTPPDLRLGQITERLGFALTADFLRTLGFEPAGRDRAAVLYHEADFPLICKSLIERINSACELVAA